MTLYDVDWHAILIKKDLINVFHHILIVSLNYWLLNFLWEERYWTNYFLSFKLRMTSYLFNLFAKELNWMFIIIKWWHSVIYYLNNFLFIQMNMIKVKQYEIKFNDLCSQLNLNINLKKNSINKINIFLSIKLNLINMITHLSFNKH